jgi:hypothetical protein
MLRLLLDEHVAPAVAAGLRRRNMALVIHAMRDWERGAFLGRDDEACLTEAARQGLTLVTYDRRTVPPLLKSWAEQGRSHGGVIFVDEKTIAPADVGGLVRALAALVRGAGKQEWNNRICFLGR